MNRTATRKTEHFSDAAALASALAARSGRKMVLALPLGLGKANTVANAIYDFASNEPAQQLSIFTALTLQRPQVSGLEAAFINPVLDRLFKDYPDLHYARALRSGTVPANIDVSEFFLLAGRWLGVAAVQQNYISANYTHAGRYVLERGINVIAQLVAKRVVNGETRYSLSCNTDLTLDLLQARAEGRADFALVAEVNSELPFMPGDGDLPESAFDFVYENRATDFPLFAVPKSPVPLTAYAIGLNASTLVADGGTLQIGIGAEGDAAAHALVLRQRDNAAYRETIARLLPFETSPPRELGTFDAGLYAATEMFVDSFLPLIDAGVVKREVDGALLQGGFFLGPKDFYRRLREMGDGERAKLQMKAISYVNQLYGDEAKKRAARVKARFINNGMMATMLGAIVSDGLDDGKVVSGVGGQYNFVAQAFALDDARSIICVNATRTSSGSTSSNIIWNYGHTTIPRHLRDIVVTEYGIADLRGKSDAQVVAAMLSIADSRFQPELLRKAKDVGKIARNYEIPAAHRNNTPERIILALSSAKERGLLPDFPFGTDFNETEQRLVPALQTLKTASASPLTLLRLAMRGFSAKENEKMREALTRVQLDAPTDLRGKLYRMLLKGALV
ncbi:MAG: acetyl-CoA hydrolase [Xanthobacteraceae bacterium]|nr:acetyl-CoA hydrolase [Xanthobacteraceae bacterium]QYK45748.1 MAG: acetyl-CoA hydrolase [Xanthobacteraceae bacterium]